MKRPVMSQELLAVFLRTENGTDVFETIKPLPKEFSTIEEYAYFVEARMGKLSPAGGAESLCARFHEASFEYLAAQPEPNRARYPTLQDIADGASIPAWLRPTKQEPQKLEAPIYRQNEPPVPSDYAKWPQEKRDAYCAKRAKEYRERREGNDK